MERRTIQLSFQQSEVYEVGAALLVLLACPQEKSEARLGDLQASLCAKAIWLKNFAEPDNTTPITVKPPYVFRDSKRIDRDVSFVSKRLGERLVAGRMMIPFLQRAVLGHMPKLPSDIKNLSVNRMAAFVLDDAEQSDVGNVKRRYWAPSRPVIHLSVATLIIAKEFKKLEIQLNFENLLLGRDLIERIVQAGHEFEDVIAQDANSPVKLESLIQVRLV
jgi:hypothetical protein